jgi:anti-sigma-K factor RskA
VRRPDRCTRPELAQALASYVLGGCADDEAAAVRRHLANCASCSATVAVLAPTRDRLLTDVAPAEPPDRLRSEVMRRVRSDATLFDAARAPERPARSGRFARLLAPRPVWALGLVALVAVIATLALDGTFAADRETVYEAQVDGVAAPGGRASLVVQDEEMRLLVSGLPAAGEGRMYEVWADGPTGPPRPAGARFSVDASGSGEVAMRSTPSTGLELMVTSERGGTATTPTRAPILRVRI